jgi:citrate lyase subunit alpha/citrate CoA-transferase
MVNSIGRRIPDVIPGYKKISPYSGPFAPAPEGKRAGPTLKSYPPSHKKILSSIEEAIEASGLKDGMTISFHHALRNGDRVMNTVMSIIAKMGFRNLRLAPSSFLDTNDDLIPYFEAGVITAAQTSGVRGRLGEYLTRTRLPDMTVIRTHGGRVRAITDGTLHIDIAFLAAPACDRLGNINGVEGPSACGSLGYAMIDARYADTVVAITDNLTDHVLCPISIPHHFVDYIVPVDSIGDPHGISSGSLRLTTNPRDLLLAKLAARIIEKSGYYREGFALQLGAGAASVAVGRFLRESMLRDRITADFAIGGIPGPFCDLLDEGLIRTIFDAQSFDLRAISSLRDNPRHQEYDIDQYANPWNKGCDGELPRLCGSWSHRGRHQFQRECHHRFQRPNNGGSRRTPRRFSRRQVHYYCHSSGARQASHRHGLRSDHQYPGETVDVVVTERGIAINPKRADLRGSLQTRASRSSGLKNSAI